MTARIQSFEEFWPYYVGEHRDPVCRALHYAGTSMAIGTVAAAAITWNPLWLLATPVVGYGPAWIGHFFVEHNRPATFEYPAWSLLADFKMLGLALRGQMADEVTRLYGSPSPAREAPLLVPR
ncbi:MAG: DUF962 domain-containing protein [Sandaracinaceae bacterium]|nr:DUF962 domain-containing protein [Sandaracinaceae bacterium]